MRTIPLTQGREALVDDIDYAFLTRWKWCYHHGYATRSIHPGEEYMHKVVARRCGLDAKGQEIDHWDINPLNNQRANLRVATHQQNCSNRKRPGHNTTGYKGVSFLKKSQKWAASIGHGYRLRSLGTYMTAELAAAAYDAAARELHGDFAAINGVTTSFVSSLGTRSDNTSGFRGVNWSKSSKRWAARIHVHGKRMHLGYFDDKLEAAKAYNEAALKYFGEFAYLNPIKP